jgi:hypothetical protein
MTASGSIDKRHVSAESFGRYLDSRVPVLLRIPGTPEGFVFLEPLKRELGLRLEIRSDAEVPATGLRNIIARIAMRDGKRFLEVLITMPELFRDAYPLLCAMSDRVQVAGMSPSRALLATLETMSTLLRAPDSLSREREIGLFGELLVLCGLIDALGDNGAVRAWRGADAEEHDFGLPSLDVEVKTTTSERRAHWIESLTQLVPTRDRPLWLVSHQLTAAGSGRGVSLSDLVDLVRAKAHSIVARDRVEEALASAGWLEDERERLTARWTRRTESAAYRVAGSFPRLTAEALRQGGIPLDRIPEVRYRVDLDGLALEQDVPAIIMTVIGFEGWI